MNDTPVACQTRGPTDPQGDRWHGEAETDEGSFVPRPARRQCPPNTTAALAATYPLRRFAPQWARFDNRPTSGGGFKRRGPKPPPLSLQGVRILKERGKFEIPLSLSGVLWLLSFDMKRKQLAPAGATPAYPRAKGSLDRRSKWFSLVPFFLQKKKGTRAGARNAPSPARRRNTCTFPRQGSLET